VAQIRVHNYLLTSNQTLNPIVTLTLTLSVREGVKEADDLAVRALMTALILSMK